MLLLYMFHLASSFFAIICQLFDQQTTAADVAHTNYNTKRKQPNLKHHTQSNQLFKFINFIVI